MKKLIVLTLTVLMVLSLVAPGIALAGTTSVQINAGQNYAIVKCKWEVVADTYDDDPIQAGLQVNPPRVAGAKRAIYYYAVVTHTAGVANVLRVDADVYHPDGSPYPYDDSVVGGMPQLPYFKYEIPFEPWGTGDAAEALFSEADAHNLVTYATEYNYAEVLDELDKGTAEIWVGCAPIDYEQPAGMYTVYVYAADVTGYSDPLVNQFEYVPMCGIEVDFDAVDFGPTNLGVDKMISGDKDWNPNDPDTNNATVRNVGNVWTSVQVTFDDMKFGKDINEKWNVEFDARMGSNPAYHEVDIMPYETRTLTNALGLSMKDELDFSIKVLKGTGSHNGEMILDCIPVYPFTDPSPYSVSDIVGLDARGDYTSEPNPCGETGG